MDGVTKTFGGVTAVSDVSWTAQAGAAIGIIGPNGAGKSTLLKLLAGVLRPDRGDVLFQREPLRRSPHRVARAGIAMAHQTPRPFRSLSVRDNVRVAVQRSWRLPSGSARQQHADAQEVLERCGLGGKAATAAGSLGLLDLKRLEVARALALRPSVLLLDEVAAGLNGRDLDQAIELIAGVHQAGTTIVVVEHIDRVIRDLVDRVLVLDWGRLIADGTPAEIAADDEVRRVYLGTASAGSVERRVCGPRPAPVVELSNVSARYGDVVALSEISIGIGAGEVVGVLGANGAGKSTLASVLSGHQPASAGRVRAFGQDVTATATHLRARAGIAHCPEGRHVFADLTVAENLDVAVPPRTRSAAAATRLELVKSVFPKLGDRRNQLAGTLSGGEQQMLSIGRALMTNPKLLICDELSLGLAPVAIESIYAALREIAASGVMLIVIEQDVRRCLEIADWVYVLLRGRLSYQGSPDALTDEQYLDSVYFGREATA
jgi:ABC-type branched-subunit amino acid transport system ATPase component